ncbi:hypothetical protein RJ639_018963 [Escallonia herrerae]|uniref:Disease resistance protein n=1 Tax=Escallonia herrerae TaxID=1293975 RepID=A0AA88UXI2_9ASTE|nr:hypothetical protein RJ639_025892 [Escallonia herrerae]KAK3003805.1 hypothetical protein RJ639_018963 [Escallonia herrerae]
MAEAVLGVLLDTLTRLLSQEANLVLGVEDEVKSLVQELKLTHFYLVDLEEKGKEQDIVREYANQIRGLVREAEDLIDTHVANIAQQRGDNIFQNAARTVARIAKRRAVAKKINRIKTQFEALYKKRDKFEIQIAQKRESAVEDDLSRSARWHMPFEKADVVGFEADTQAILQQLLEGHADREIISILGMSGIGKTTLAGNLFHDPAVVHHFDYQTWVCVSQVGNNVREFLKALMKNAMEGDETTEEIRHKIYRILKSQRYLIVLDDVWETEWLENLDRFLPKNALGSRVILTTQIEGVALTVNPSPHNLKLLSPESSWELLSKRVFQGQECPPELKVPGSDIAKQCGGLPLAIVVIAGVLLRKEKTVRWWSRVSSRVGDFLGGDREIFKISYENLPYYLRPCFLYFGQYPADSEISSWLLMKLWVAEGFIPRKEGMQAEEVAEDYLEDLVGRNLINLVEKKFDGGIKSCSIHGLLRAFCISKASEEKFLEVKEKNSSSPGNARRLAVHSSTTRYISSCESSSTLRSLRCLGQDEERLSSTHLKRLYRGYMLLKVLDLSGVVVGDIPSEIENLICLRYLRLKSDSARSLPSSLCNIFNLQTLEIVAPLIDRPQVNVWKLRELRHFYFNGEAVLPEPPKKKVNGEDICLSNLQTLSSISPDSCTESIVSELPNLVKLGIYGDLEMHKDLVFKNLSKLNLLRKLKLKRYRVYGSLSRIPDGVQLPPTLIKLTLSQTELQSDPMQQVGQLPNLRVLKLIDGAYVGGELDCTNCGGFPKLEVLKLVNLGITQWNVPTDSMKSLKKVVIKRCGKLERLPSALKSISTLKEMHLWWPNEQVVTCARDVETYKEDEKFKLMIYHPESREGVQ